MQAEDLDLVGVGAADLQVDRQAADGAVRLVEALEVAGQFASRDLRRRPPQRVSGHARLVPRAAAHERRGPLGHQDPVDHRRERLRLQVRAGARGDVVGRRVSLLAGQPALLDRERRDVPRRVHVRHTGDAAVPVGDEEAVAVARQAGDAPADQPRQRDHPQHLQLAAGRELQPGALDALGPRTGVQDDAGLAQQPGDLARRLGAERRQRRRLGRDDVDLQRRAHLIGALGQHQRQLVQRQRPARAVRHHERHAPRVAALDVLDQPVHGLDVVLRAAEHDRRLKRPRLHRAGRDQQHVIPDRLTRAGRGDVRGRVDARQRARPVREARVGGDPGQRVGGGAAGGERVEHAQRAVHEVALGGEQRGGHTARGHAVQPQRGLQRSGAASGDQDIGRHVRHATREPTTRPPGQRRVRFAGNPQPGISDPGIAGSSPSCRSRAACGRPDWSR